MVRLQMILSPAKTLNFDGHGVPFEARRPIGVETADALAEMLARESVGSLRDILSVSASIAQENKARYEEWTEAPKVPAILAYDGFAFDKLRGRHLSAESLEVAHSRLVVLSGLWGPVRALDWIKPYRLEMGCKKLPEPYKKLSLYWKETATRCVLDGFTAEPRLLLNVASDEYAAAVDLRGLKESGVQIIKADFTDAAGTRQPTVHLKYARGLLARYVIINDVDSLEALEGFDLEEYEHARTEGDRIVFKKGDPRTKRAKTSA
ncbi:hypothetical protein CTAYLR_005407 [Chrysophaeum taylorii]|uniref:Uncharacterized protein n=1 Tax=Chrysophaeum taylorii TaxID=2483200 RepID=A0AAD7U7E5_9STRA|nr:hypothetical protein CTAYLR_005407 [Chrysophaeum taylorii]